MRTAKEGPLRPTLVGRTENIESPSAVDKGASLEQITDCVFEKLVAHLHTLTAAIPPVGHRARGERVEFALPGGGKLVGELDRVAGRGPMALVVHGAGGSSRSSYVLEAAATLNRAGFHALRLNCRGGGLGRGLANGHYHAGLSEDLDLVVRALGARPFVSDVSLFGFSLGGHMCLHLLGAWGSAAPECVRGAVTISAPVDLVHASELVWNGPPDIYERSIVAVLRDNALALKDRLPKAIPSSRERIASIARIWEIDALVLSPLFGFANKEDYYARASASRTISAVRVPTMAFHAHDDPVVPFVSVARHLENHPAFTVSLEATGGHVGFSALGFSGLRNFAVEGGVRFLATR